MQSYIIIENFDSISDFYGTSVYLVNTDDQVAEARLALRQLGLDKIDIWRGDCDHAVKSGILFSN